MTRVFKGRRGGKPKLVCVVAKKRGRGSCRYRAVNVGDVEAALYADLPRILAEAPLADGFADDRLREIDAALSGLDDVIGDAEGRPRSAANAALKRQLTSVKAGLVAERASVVRALDERTDAVVQARFDALREALSTRDVVQVNAALGRVFSRVIIDPDAGMLRFVWSHGDGAESATMYKFPGVATRH